MMAHAAANLSAVAAGSGEKRGRVAILDDFFPHVGSAFRFEEFRSYLDAMPEACVYSTGAALHHADETRSIEDLIAEHVGLHPNHAGRVAPLDYDVLPPADVYYATFVYIIMGVIEAIERLRKPFAVTLYPGGGFALEDESSDAQLRRVLGSPCFRGVIATQPITKAYLLEKGFCRPDQIVDLNGGVLARAMLPPPVGKLCYAFDKPVLDIAFVANRYGPIGADKGYDLFVDAAKRLIGSGIDLHFHVVGRFDASIIDLAEATAWFTFHGLQLTPFFDVFYRTIDVIVSPTRPFVLGPGKFDGFPTGCSVEAGTREVAIICTDELGQNVSYVDGEDLIIVRPEADAIVAAIEMLAADPARLRALGVNARRRALDLYSHAKQIEPRIDLLRNLAAEGAES